jgi:hypothetical protein
MAKRCHTCKRNFGLVRHRYGLKQFCRKKCLEKYKDGLGRELCGRRGWFHLLAPSRASSSLLTEEAMLAELIIDR